MCYIYKVCSTQYLIRYRTTVAQLITQLINGYPARSDQMPTQIKDAHHETYFLNNVSE